VIELLAGYAAVSRTPTRSRCQFALASFADDESCAWTESELVRRHQRGGTMGKLIVTEFVTLDGVAQAPGAPDEDRDGGFTHGGWQAPLPDQEADGVVFEQAKTMDALLLGRRTYEIFAGYWPGAPDDIPFTGLLNRVPKYVASRTLADPLAWRGSTVLAEPIAESVTSLKERHDELHVIGSLNLVQALLSSSLVDRLNLWLYPLLLGSGKRVFADGALPTALRLTESVTYPNGTLHLAYEPVGVPTYGNLAI
jgi:dihydrofolate reductase